jgi:zinc/manganese transport system substrate-binding protein
MKTLFFRLILLVLGVARLSAAEPLRISVFSTVLTEVAQRVGGDQVRVTGHVPVGADPHEFEPRPSDLKTVAGADLILLSAKHMEGYVGKLREVTGGRVRVLEVGDQMPGLWLKEGKEAKNEKPLPRYSKGASGVGGREHGHTHAHAGEGKIEDPHWWHSIENMRRAVRMVRDECARLRPGQKSAFEANAAVFEKELGELQQWAKARIAELPRDRRKLVTSHEAFQYFAKEFGFTVYYVEGLTESDQPASRKVADLLTVIQQQKVKAVFAQDAVNPKVLKEITASTGAKLGGQLWADGLGPKEASTYAGMFRHNVNTLVEALK